MSPAPLLLFAGALALRVAGIGAENLWYDESFTAWLAGLDFGHMMTAIRGDVHPPLWYVIEWGIVRVFGSSEWSLRLPSAVLGAVAVLLVWRVALALGLSQRVALVAGALAAINPAALYYSQEARMYSLLSVAVLGAVYAGITRRWQWFSLACIVTVYTHNLGVFYAAVVFAAVGVGELIQRNNLARWALAGLGVGIGYAAWLPSLLAQAGAVKAGFWIQPMTLGAAVLPLSTLTGGWRLPEALQVHVYSALIALSGVGLIAARKWLATRPGLIYASVLLGVPAVIGTVSVLWRSVWLYRAFVPCAMLLCIVWAYALTSLDKRNRRVAQAVAVPMLAVGLVCHYWPATNARFDTRSYAEIIRAEYRPGDVIYHMAIDSAVLMGYYTSDLPAALLPHASDLNQSLTPETRAAMGFNEVAFDDLRGRGGRVILVAKANPLTTQQQRTAVANILTYPHHEIARFANEYNEMVIYIVTL
jgi:uncharacterized membrane protein